MKAMILAAGRGERLRPLTDTTPKPLIEVGGKPLIQWHIERLCAAGFSEIVVNVSWLKEQLVAFLGNGSRWGVLIRISEEPQGALDTGGGIFNALPLLGSEPFFVVNGDVFTDYPFATADLPGGDDLAHLVLVSGPARDFTLSGNRLGNTGTDMLTYAGIGFYSPQLFASCHAGTFPLAPLIRNAADAGRAGGGLYTGRWHDIGTPERLASLRSELSTEN